jgi:hypothetical protein
LLETEEGNLRRRAL